MAPDPLRRRPQLRFVTETSYSTTPSTGEIRRIEPLAPPAATPAPRVERAGWFPMPGGRLEYSATGFYIELHPELQPIERYQLFTPEGQFTGCAPFLVDLQVMAERFAADREAFTPKQPR